MNQTKKLHETDMTVGPPLKLIFSFSMPLLLGNLFQQLYNTVDSIIVGNFVGKYALAGVSAGFPFIMMLVSFFIGIGIASTIMISQAFGAKDFDKVHIISSTIYKSLLVSVIPVSIIGIITTRPILILMNVPDDGTLALCVTYLHVIFFGLIGMVGFNLNAGILQGVGDSVTSVKYLIIAALINIVFDLIFVIPMQMGVFGAALATVISQFVSWILGILHINKHYHYLRVDFKDMPFDKEVFKRSLKLGIPSALQNSVFSIGIIVLESLINTFGTDFIAGYQSALKVDNFVFLPIQSYANAITTYTGQNVGAKRPDRIREGRKAGLYLSFITCVVVGIILFPLSNLVMSMFSNDSNVIYVGTLYLHTVLPFYFLLALLFIHNSILRGVGKMTIPMLTSFVSLWIARVPAAYLLTDLFGPYSVFFAYPLGWILGDIITLIYYYSGKWQKDIKTA